MCFYSIPKIELKIAKEDIIVYKLLWKNNLPRFNYNKKFVYKEFNIHFSKITILRNERKVNRALHSYKKRPKNFGQGLKLVKMIIPKGAYYAENEREYISNILITTKLDPETALSPGVKELSKWHVNY